ncbi:MAG: Uma2 family endonuclease [Jatrophihabitantaceae bacterium]
MATPTTTGRPFTTDDLDAMPDDGHRYELVDGELLVSPGPAWQHQEAVGALSGVLRAVCPSELRVVIAPFSVRPDKHNDLQPDVLVARYADLTAGGGPVKNLTAAPVLAVEVISPSSRLIDPHLKKALYARLGVRSFWLIDPDPQQPELTAYVLVSGEYQETARVIGDQAYRAQEPFVATVVPSELVRGLLPS